MIASALPADAAQAAVLLIPGLEDSGPDHWQSLWERDDAHCHKVDLGLWDRPHRNTWVNKLNLAIYRAAQNGQRPVVLVAHSLGCMVAAWWARLEQPTYGDPVVGALLVAPPEVDFFPRDERLSVFAPTPAEPLPFPSIMVASHDDPWIGFAGARSLARRWGSELIDAGRAGHLNAESDLGHWPEGRRLLARLLDRRETPTLARAADAAIPQGFIQGAAQ